MQSKTILDLLSNELYRRFIEENLQKDVKKLAFVAIKSQIPDIKTVCNLIQLYQKAKAKLPYHYGIMAAMNSKSYEQSTSERVAEFKAQLMDLKGKHVLNLTGGLGIDDWAMAKYAAKIDSCDTDAEIHLLANYNIQKYSQVNILRHVEDGLKFVRDIDYADVIYADPDRRPGKTRVFMLEDCVPDILPELESLLNKCGKLWIKLSPMADLTYLKGRIGNIRKLYVIALEGEVKEILICCEKAAKEPDPGEAFISAVNLREKPQIYSAKPVSKPQTGISGNYLYEPNGAIIKAGLGHQYAVEIGARMPSWNSYIYLTDRILPEFQGRAFTIEHHMMYKPRLLASFLNQKGIRKASVTVRNFRLRPEAIKQKFRLQDGGEFYLFFTTDTENTGHVYLCKKPAAEN